jgi:hypothetical protein
VQLAVVAEAASPSWRVTLVAPTIGREGPQQQQEEEEEEEGRSR